MTANRMESSYNSSFTFNAILHTVNIVLHGQPILHHFLNIQMDGDLRLSKPLHQPECYVCHYNDWRNMPHLQGAERGVYLICLVCLISDCGGQLFSVPLYLYSDLPNHLCSR